MSGVYTFNNLLMLVIGCDSTATFVNLTINNSSTSSETAVTACDSFDWNGVTYTDSFDWNGTYIHLQLLML